MKNKKTNAGRPPGRLAGVRRFSGRLSAFRRDKRHDGDGSGALDRHGQFALMLGAVSGDAARHDFSAFRHEITQNHGVFIVDLDIGVRAEPAEFLSVKEFFLRRTRRSV